MCAVSPGAGFRSDRQAGVICTLIGVMAANVGHSLLAIPLASELSCASTCICKPMHFIAAVLSSGFLSPHLTCLLLSAALHQVTCLILSFSILCSSAEEQEGCCQQGGEAPNQQLPAPGSPTPGIFCQAGHQQRDTAAQPGGTGAYLDAWTTCQCCSCHCLSLPA